MGEAARAIECGIWSHTLDYAREAGMSNQDTSATLRWDIDKALIIAYTDYHLQ